LCAFREGERHAGLSRKIHRGELIRKQDGSIVSPRYVGDRPLGHVRLGETGGRVRALVATFGLSRSKARSFRLEMSSGHLQSCYVGKSSPDNGREVETCEHRFEGRVDKTDNIGRVENLSNDYQLKLARLFWRSRWFWSVELSGRCWYKWRHGTIEGMRLPSCPKSSERKPFRPPRFLGLGDPPSLG